MKQQAPRTMEFSIHDFATTLPKLYDTCVRIGKLIRTPVHSGEGNVCSSRGDWIFSVLPPFKATTKPEKCHLFSGPCSGTENCKSSALQFDCGRPVFALSSAAQHTRRNRNTQVGRWASLSFLLNHIYQQQRDTHRITTSMTKLR